MMKFSVKEPTITSQPTIKDKPDIQESRQQPLWHVVVLCVLTCSAYLFYWFYKNWRDLKEQAEKAGETEAALAQFNNISPMLRTIGLLVPILHIYLSLTQVKGIAELHPNRSSYPARHSLIASGIVVGCMLGLLYLRVLPGSLYLLSFSVGIPMAIVQSWLNAYWRSCEPPSLSVRHAFTGKELIAIIVGSLWLGLILVYFFIT